MSNDERGKQIYKDYLLSKGATNIVIPFQRYNRFDLVYTLHNVRYVSEIKYRTCDSTKYSSVMLEKVKLDGLLKSTDESIEYINIYQDNVIFKFDLRNIGKVRWYKRYLPIDEAKKVYKIKEVCYLPLYKAEKINLI